MYGYLFEHTFDKNYTHVQVIKTFLAKSYEHVTQKCKQSEPQFIINSIMDFFYPK